MLALDRKTVEVKQLKDEILVVKIIAEELRTTNEHLNTDISGLNQEIQTVNSLLVKTKKEAEDQTQKVVAPVIVDNSMAEYKAQADIKLQLQETYIETLKKQIISIAMESNKKINDQQAQLQGVEALIDGIKLEYDEFIKITKIETDSFKLNQSAEFESLRLSFEKHKIEQFEEKKQLMSEYQLILFNLQSEFDEYRTTVEYLMNMEVAKLQDELSTQSIRNQQEIMYIIQAKDKFYTDMMVSKDAKIMSLIEGSDLQQIVQKHELDVENLRKDHQREIERVKTDQESEQKNLISLLQRQNVSFESKCEKLQSHLKTMENKSRELMSTIESKNKMLIERDELKVKAEIEFSKYIEEFKKKIELISVEKEQLRHKVIRMNLNAKGDGANTVANMVKRLTRVFFTNQGNNKIVY